MRYTLLELTQNILSSMDSDEVNSISDTTESRQIAETIRTAYYNIIARTDLPEHRELVQLDASTSSSIPVTMTVPDRVNKIYWLKYYDDDALNYSYVTFVSLQEFIDDQLGLNVADTNVQTYTLTDNGLTFTLRYRDDIQPTKCSLVSDHQVIFNSYNSTVDSTLQSSKTLAEAQVIPTFTLSDSFTPDLDDAQFPLLLNEAKALAFMELKQMPNAKAEQEAKRQWSSVQRDKAVVNRPTYFDQFPNFGRK